MKVKCLCSLFSNIYVRRQDHAWISLWLFTYVVRLYQCEAPSKEQVFQKTNLYITFQNSHPGEHNGRLHSIVIRSISLVESSSTRWSNRPCGCKLSLLDGPIKAHVVQRASIDRTLNPFLKSSFVVGRMPSTCSRESLRLPQLEFRRENPLVDCNGMYRYAFFHHSLEWFTSDPNGLP